MFIDNDIEIPSNKPCFELVLKGLAATPKIVFDRTEIILPITPLGIESRCCFKVINEGYENLNLKDKIRVMEELGNVKINLNFIDGSILGIAKNKCKLEAVFVN